MSTLTVRFLCKKLRIVKYVLFQAALRFVVEKLSSFEDPYNPSIFGRLDGIDPYSAYSCEYYSGLLFPDPSNFHLNVFEPLSLGTAISNIQTHFFSTTLMAVVFCSKWWSVCIRKSHRTFTCSFSIIFSGSYSNQFSFVEKLYFLPKLQWLLCYAGQGIRFV